MPKHRTEDDTTRHVGQADEAAASAAGPAQVAAVAADVGAAAAAPGDNAAAEGPGPVEAAAVEAEEEAAAPEAVPVVEEEAAVTEPPAAGDPAVAEEEAGPAAGWLKHHHGAFLEPQSKERRRLLFGLGGLVLLLIVTGTLFGRYVWRPGPLPELLPLPVDLNYRPHYLFSIYGVKQPVGVAVSPDGERIYATETGGKREVKSFDRDGYFLGSFAPPQTEPAERAPVYVAVDPAGRVFVADRLQRAVFVYGSDGKMLDAILGPDLTLSKYLSQQVQGVQPDGVLAFNRLQGAVLYQAAGQREQVLPAPDPAGWAPLGVRVDEQGTMLLTNVAEGQHVVREFPGEMILAATWLKFDPPQLAFGTQGQGSAELLFPNSAVADSQGRIYVTDGNNGRISVWDGLGTFLFTFGRGVGEGALSLPRGAAMDGRDRLHVVDAVQQAVKVYDVSGPEPRYLYTFGDWGTKDGQFNFPGDIALDSTGRLYIADRKNNRIQVWSY